MPDQTVTYSVLIHGTQAPVRWQLVKRGPNSYHDVKVADDRARGEADSHNQAFGDAYRAAEGLEAERIEKETTVEMQLFISPGAPLKQKIDPFAVPGETIPGWVPDEFAIDDPEIIARREATLRAAEEAAAAE
jgi:hypothetical protein